MSYDRLETRLRAVEEDRSTSDALLRFDDGSTRAVRVKDPLSLLLDAMRERSRQLGPPEGSEDDPRPENPPLTRHAEAIKLIGRAERIESDDPLLNLVFESAKGVHDANVTEKSIPKT